MAITSYLVANKEIAKEFTHCRSCAHGELIPVFDLGAHAVSDFYDPNNIPDPEPKIPLCLVQCSLCGLVQLSHSVNRDRLYNDTYWYQSHINESMVAALKDIVEDALGRTLIERGDRVLDIGANDGTLLNQYPAHSSLHRVGIDPAFYGECPFFNGKSTWIKSYYPCEPWLLDELRPFKIITSIAMFYDLDDPLSFVRSVSDDLHAHGIWINQMMDLEAMLSTNAFDNICHEHVGYWRESDLDRLLSLCDLNISDISYNNTNGGSVRYIIRHGHERTVRIDSSYTQAFKYFASRVQQEKNNCMAFLENCRRTGKKVLGYGASTKGNTLLQYYGINTRLLPAIADRNPNKHGKVTAGQHIPIISEAAMRDQKPDYLLVLPWAFLDNFKAREVELRAQGTKFIVPLPFFRVE